MSGPELARKSKRGDQVREPSAPRRARGSLSEDEILDGAHDLIERDGLSALSMPALARHLSSGVTSIYWYFRSKDDLLTALAERVTASMYAELPPVGDSEWSVELENCFLAFRDAAKRSPVYLELFEHRARFLMSRAPVADAVLGRVEDTIAVLVRVGLSVDEAASVYASCSAFTRGFVLLEHGLIREEVDSSVDEKVDLHVARLDATAYPNLTQLSSFKQAMSLDDAEFRLGLRLKIAGVRALFNLE